MRILFTGGGTGGHFYPIISIAAELKNIAKEKRLLEPELFFMSSAPYDKGLLFEQGITYKRNTAGKLRRSAGLIGIAKNFFDLFKTGWGLIVSTLQIYKIYPDVIFGKGGYASFPALLAGRILRIPVIIHESDTVPGRVNLWAGKFALRVAISYKEAAQYFSAEKVAYTGQPMRKEITAPISEGSREFLKLEEGLPVVLVLGGSQGAEKINDAVIQALARLVEKYGVVHQTGDKNFREVRTTADAVLADSRYKERYKPFPYLSALTLRMAAGVSSVVVSRAGSSIFEIASWGVPAIIVPINERVSRDQRSNAFSYARAGGAVVVEEENLSPNLLYSEVERLVTRGDVRDKMVASAKAFHKPDAARLIAEEILKVALSHEIEK